MPAQRVERAVRMGRSTISSLAITGFLTIGAASAAHDQQAKAIYTASQSGAVDRGAPNVTYSSRKLFLASILARLEREGLTEWVEAILTRKISAFAVAVELGWAKRPQTLSGENCNQARRRAFDIRALIG
jgi:hypothetical protein